MALLAFHVNWEGGRLGRHGSGRRNFGRRRNRRRRSGRWLRQVRSVAAALEEFPIEKKAREFDSTAADKAGIYVAKHDTEELKEYFVQLRSFYDGAARKGNGVLLWIE